MRRATAIVLFGLVVTLLSVRPASAQWEWFKWIQELSGPGPFELSGVTVTFSCTEHADGKQVALPAGAPAYRFLLCDRNPENWWKVTRFWGVTVATGDGKNNLTFPSGLDKLERVSASLYLIKSVARLDPAVDVGLAAGFMRFSGTPSVTVTKYVIDPYVAVRPFALGIQRNASQVDRVRGFFARAVEVNAGAIIFPQGFRVSDFGAIGGPSLTGDAEVSWHAGLRFSIVF